MEEEEERVPDALNREEMGSNRQLRLPNDFIDTYVAENHVADASSGIGEPGDSTDAFDFEEAPETSQTSFPSSSRVAAASNITGDRSVRRRQFQIPIIRGGDKFYAFRPKRR